MELTNSEKALIQKLRSTETVYTAFSKATSLPYVECDEETFDDQAHLFFTEESVVAYVKEHGDNGLPLVSISIQKKDMLPFYTSLHMIGVNRILCHGEDTEALALDKIVKLQMPKVQNPDIPTSNTSLQLTAVYFMQELRKPKNKEIRVTAAEHRAHMAHLRELEQELVANLVRSKFIIPVDAEKKPDADDTGALRAQISLPYLKNQDGEILQPVFSDLWEFQKYNERHPKNLQMMPVKDLSHLRPLMIEDATAYVLNPSGVNLVLTRDKLDAIINAHFGS